MENENEQKIAGGAEILAWSDGGGGSGMTQGGRGRGLACAAADTQNNAADGSQATINAQNACLGPPGNSHPLTSIQSKVCGDWQQIIEVTYFRFSLKYH